MKIPNIIHYLFKYQINHAQRLLKYINQAVKNVAVNRGFNPKAILYQPPNWDNHFNHYKW